MGGCCLPRRSPDGKRTKVDSGGCVSRSCGLQSSTAAYINSQSARATLAMCEH